MIRTKTIMVFKHYVIVPCPDVAVILCAWICAVDGVLKVYPLYHPALLVHVIRQNPIFTLNLPVRSIFLIKYRQHLVPPTLGETNNNFRYLTIVERDVSLYRNAIP